MSKHTPKIIVIVGPTASGKSDLAIVFARRFNGEIISADSRQVYRGMDLGTGKVTKHEQKLAKHWLLDVVNPKRQFTVANFQCLGRAAIADALSREKLPIICGGTGFYIDALVYNTQLPNVKPNKKLRAVLEKLSAEKLFTRLSNLDPVRASDIDRHNKRRLIRALEIIATTGTSIPVVRQKQSAKSPYDTLWLGIAQPKKELEERIAASVNKRFRQGMVAEIKRLHEGGISWKRLESFGLAYKIIPQYLRGEMRLQEVKTRLIRAEQQYAKRQMTWFKCNHAIHWTTNRKQAVTAYSKFLA